MICWILLDVCSTTVLIQLPSLKWEGRQEMLLLEMILNLEQLYSVKIIFMHGIVIVIIRIKTEILEYIWSKDDVRNIKDKTVKICLHKVLLQW